MQTSLLVIAKKAQEKKDLRFFNLYHDTPATCYGPAAGNLHAPDEWVDLTSLEATTKVLARTIMDWCGRE